MVLSGLPRPVAPGPVPEGVHPALGERRPGGEHRRSRQARLQGDRVVRHPLAGQEDHPAPLRQSLWRRPSTHQGFQLLSLDSTEV